jgi:hypothetical protein
MIPEQKSSQPISISPNAGNSSAMWTAPPQWVSLADLIMIREERNEK